MAGAVSKRVLDVRGAAEYLMVSAHTITRLANKGQLGRRVGKLWRFKIEDLDRLLMNDGSMDNDNRGASNEQVEVRNA